MSPGGQHQTHIVNSQREGKGGVGHQGEKKLPVKALRPSLLTVLEGGLAPLQFKLQLVDLLRATCSKMQAAVLARRQLDTGYWHRIACGENKQVLQSAFSGSHVPVSLHFCLSVAVLVLPVCLFHVNVTCLLLCYLSVCYCVTCLLLCSCYLSVTVLVLPVIVLVIPVCLLLC